MPARHDHHRVQTGDGYAAYVAGQVVGAEIGVTTDEQASWWGGRGLGTVPHALIAAYDGDTVRAAAKFAEWASDDMNVTVLVDFENDSVRHRARGCGRARAAAVGHSARHVRVARRPVALGRARATSSRPASTSGSSGSCAMHSMWRAIRAVRVVVSGGFTLDKIREFEEHGVPVDAYGIGSSLIRGSNDFTADIVMTDGAPSAKVGRRYRPSSRLELVT